jgi:F0F1-type ATP synthase alpha subunit
MNDSYENLIKLLSLFKNRPYHLAKYLITNSALKEGFIEKLKDSKISELENENVNFLTIEEMENYYQSLIDLKNIEKKSKKEIELELNKKLDDAILLENYEEASRIRDYMRLKNFKRISKKQ